jgi:hypothetical protein
MFRYKYSLLIIFNIIALQSCLLVNDGRYISESLPYRLELTVSRKLSESNIAWGTVIHDPLKNEDIIIKLENIYTSKDGYFFESVLDIFNPDLKLLRRIIFHSFDYPLLRGVRVLPYTEDINKNGSSDLFILLQYNDRLDAMISICHVTKIGYQDIR